MPSNALKRKKKQKENSTSIQSSQRNTRSATLRERTLHAEQSVREKLLNKLYQGTHVEDKNAIEVFKHHAISNVDVATLQSYSKLGETGQYKKLINIINRIYLFFVNIIA